MPAYQVGQKFFRDSLMPLHKYWQNALLDATTAIVNGASFSLTSIGRYMPGGAQVKNKIKRYGMGLRTSYSRSAGRLLILSLLAMLSTIALWMLGYRAEKKDYI